MPKDILFRHELCRAKARGKIESHLVDDASILHDSLSTDNDEIHLRGSEEFVNREARRSSRSEISTFSMTCAMAESMMTLTGIPASASRAAVFSLPVEGGIVSLRLR